MAREISLSCPAPRGRELQPDRDRGHIFRGRTVLNRSDGVLHSPSAGGPAPSELSGYRFRRRKFGRDGGAACDCRSAGPAVNRLRAREAPEFGNRNRIGRALTYSFRAVLPVSGSPYSRGRFQPGIEQTGEKRVLSQRRSCAEDEDSACVFRPHMEGHRIVVTGHFPR